MPRTETEVEALLPLTPTVFEVLLAVAGEPRHGYAIMQEVNERGDSKIGVGPGTIYGAIRRMVEAGVLEEAASPPQESADSRRRYYQATELGAAALQAEAARLRELVARVEIAARGSRA